jgi:hypothetical protein
MKLRELIASLDRLNDDSAIYAMPPWTYDSAAIVAEESEDESVPVEARAQGFEYFLEVWLAKEFLEGWIETLEHAPSLEEICERLIGYAIDDA